eukprot:jgi/Chrzof1/9375/Cz04g00150.t1
MQVCAAVVTSAAVAAVTMNMAAHAVTTEQLLFLEAWRAVDRAYVDKNFNGQSWFRVSYSLTATATRGVLSQS